MRGVRWVHRVRVRQVQRVRRVRWVPRGRRLIAPLLALCAATVTIPAAQAPSAPQDATPQTIEEFQAAAARIVSETGVPGAGLALVRADGIEWAGGVGLADRERGIPVTGDTRFRVGSVSKTFVAMSLVQLYEEDSLDIEAPLEELVPELAVENPWHRSDPVRLIHVLQHTAGFDDMHFKDRYIPEGEPEVSLGEALARNPASRRVRWRPGTRMSYSNVGYGVAGLVLETLAGQPFEDYIQEHIFDPLEMTSSSFRLTAEDETLLARGYDGDGEPVGYPRIYLRPAGNLHTTPRDLGRFVQMLLGWGEIGEAYIIDPEYLGNMEQPRTTLAARAGLRSGYGTGITSTLSLPYRVLGHNGGIDGFLSTYGYSPSRDVGYVVLLNGTGERASEALNRLSSLAIRYLKRDVEPPSKPSTTVDAAILDRYVGYYEDANPRNQFTWPIEWFVSGRTIRRDGDHLLAEPTWGAWVPLILVTESSVRLENELDASAVFTLDENGSMVLAGPNLYAERRPRWRTEVIRMPLLFAPPVIASVLPMTLLWLLRIRRARPSGFWGLKLALLLCPLTMAVPFLALVATPTRQWGAMNAGTIAVYVGTLLIPAAAALALFMTVWAWRGSASRWLLAYGTLVTIAMTGVSLYFASTELVGLRTWSY
jgi:CubicO group peptidase (beta-lactamase class C family)